VSIDVQIVGAQREAQDALDAVEHQVRELAHRAGVAPEDYEVARALFARKLGKAVARASAGKGGTVKLSHYRRWWEGYAAGLRAGRGS
jgi:hypothetical protein